MSHPMYSQVDEHVNRRWVSLRQQEAGFHREREDQPLLSNGRWVRQRNHCMPIHTGETLLFAL